MSRDRRILERCFRSLRRNSRELEVEENLVIPLLQEILGYNEQDWQQQPKVKSSRPDFYVHPKSALGTYPPYLIIEVKAANGRISKHRWQLRQYLKTSGALFGLLTNGYDFQIFFNHEGNIVPILECSQTELLQPSYFDRFKTLLWKKSAIKTINALAQRRLNFVGLTQAISKVVGRDISSLLRQQSPVVTENERGKKSMIITVFNNKGGVGKTTLTINLGAALNRLGYRVLLIDIDAQANLTMGLGLDPLQDVEEKGYKDVTDLLLNPKVTLSQVVIRKEWPNTRLDLVPSHIRLSDKEPDLIRTLDIDRVLQRKIGNNHDYDFIFIDAPPSFGKVNSIALMAADGVLIPTQLSPYPIRAIEYVIKRLKEVQSFRGDDLVFLGVAISMYDKRSSTFNTNMKNRLLEMLERCEEEDSNNLLFPEYTWIPRLNVVSLSAEKGCPIFDYQPIQGEQNSLEDARECYLALAKHLLQILRGVKR